MVNVEGAKALCACVKVERRAEKVSVGMKVKRRYKDEAVL